MFLNPLTSKDIGARSTEGRRLAHRDAQRQLQIHP